MKSNLMAEENETVNELDDANLLELAFCSAVLRSSFLRLRCSAQQLDLYVEGRARAVHIHAI